MRDGGGWDTATGRSEAGPVWDGTRAALRLPLLVGDIGNAALRDRVKRVDDEEVGILVGVATPEAVTVKPSEESFSVSGR